jgi:CRISPR-associated endonuclease/helicase Cas3
MDFFAHSSNKKGSPWEPLREHLECVANRASEFAAPFGGDKEARLAGLLHDLGKYSTLFLSRLEGKCGGLDHWSAGTIAVLREFRETAVAAALAIQGHHIGLQEGAALSLKAGADLHRLSNPDLHPFGLRLTEESVDNLLASLQADGVALSDSPQNSLYCLRAETAASMLDARMLFSALVDADFIETEAHFEGNADGTKVYRPEGPPLQAELALETALAHLARLAEETRASGDVRFMRQELLSACLCAADRSPGPLTLTAPTGAGKTLAVLAFALKHAVFNPNIRRIVMIVPFLSIIEQTAAVYRKLLEPVFGPLYVLEHHSLADIRRAGDEKGPNQDDEEEARRTARLLAENWDAPLVLTTSVQFFESLFANRPGKCRKLHRLADSVILFDEVQTLPPRFAIPSLAALSRLSERYGCTAVFSTATQPAFDHLHEKIKPYAPRGWSPERICTDSGPMFDRSRRVRIEWRVETVVSWDSVAAELSKPESDRVLCVVNLKRHAHGLIESLRKSVKEGDLFHLSTSMCPAHREKTLDEVRERLDPDRGQRPCRLISTQCIEAGVDVDFPVAWRALGPLDAIAQAAGRCNREGRLPDLGRMVVFLPEKEYGGEHLYPPGGYKEATDTTQTLMNAIRNETRVSGLSFETAFDIYDPGLFERYYRLLYDLTGAASLDPELEDALKRRSFLDVAAHYHLIGRKSTNVLVPYAEEMALFESLKKRLDADGRLTREWIRDARPLTVGLYRPKLGDIVWNYLNPAPLGRGTDAEDWFVYLEPEHYDPLLGLTPRREEDEWIT